MHGFYPVGFPAGPSALYEPSRLELLARQAGMSPDELRAVLRAEVERRRELPQDAPSRPPELVASLLSS